jgi:hypothetical protein
VRPYITLPWAHHGAPLPRTNHLIQVPHYISAVLPSRTSLICIVFAGLLAGCGASKPTPPVIELVPAGDTVATPYSEVTEAAWLGGNRWAVVAPSNDVAAVVDFTARTITPLGGARSREFRNPSGLFLANDTLYVADWGLRRLTLWTRQGHPVRAIPASSAVRGVLPRARDSAGWFYLELYPHPGPDGSGNRDSAVVLRVDPELSRFDSIARLAPLDIAEVVGDAGRRFERRVFSGVDRWGVLPDGSLWVARVYHNRVDWRSPDGKWTRGESLPDRVLEVTRYDRELFLRKFPRELRSTAQELPFAALKPPFEAALTSPTGEVWLEKSRAPADSTRRYHVVDRRGRLTEEVRLRGQGRILALGTGTALVAEPSPDGIRLIQVRLPSGTDGPVMSRSAFRSVPGGFNQ